MAATDIDGMAAAARAAHDQGFATYWVAQIFGLDALTALAVVGREVPGIEVGTAVVPTYPRHPIMLAAQALTVQQASGNRLVLGIGLSHQMVIESIFGLSYEKPVRHMREYFAALAPLLHDQHVGTTALGPRMLELAGKAAAGTITWMTGPATLAAHTVPTITKFAAGAGRPAPRVAVGLPVCVTDDAEAARERAARVFEIYGHLPAYRAMLDREGAAGPADVAIVGDEATVRAGIRRIEDAGCTDFVAAEFGQGPDRARTRELLRSLP